jgi:hypothetical protein
MKKLVFTDRQTLTAGVGSTEGGRDDETLYDGADFVEASNGICVCR